MAASLDNVSPELVSDDHVPKDAYLSEEFAALEQEHLWPKVWQIVCREEEILNVGDFVTYDVADDSLTVVRTAPDVISAYHNVCPHRGRRLTEGCGTTGGFVCRYHGWRWDLQGENTLVVDRQDWKRLDDADIRLQQAKVGVWRGFVFVNMDLDAEPLETFLSPIEELCGGYEYEKMRYTWYKTVVLDCNWKVVLEGFDEGYHVQQTHRQLLDFMDDYTVAAAHGRHGTFWYPSSLTGRFLGASPRLAGKQKNDVDYRKILLDYLDEMHFELAAIITPRAHAAAQALNDLLPPTASAGEVLQKYGELVYKAAIDDGAGWPDITPEYAAKARVDWHVFPNFVFLPSSFDGLLAYRARPGKTPDKCIFDVWALMRYAPGKQPPLQRQFHADWRDASWGRILTQDFSNFADVQLGMKSRAFTAAKTNPVQEIPISNFHRALRDFIVNGPRPDAGKNAGPKLVRNAG